MNTTDKITDNMQNCQEHPRIETGYTFGFHYNYEDILITRFSPDGTKFIVVYNNTVVVRDAYSFNVLNEHHIDEELIFSAKFSPDSQNVAIGLENGAILLWDIKNDQICKTFEGHTNICRDISFSSDGKRIVSASSDKSIRIWDVKTGECLQIINGHTAVVSAASFSPDGKKILSGSWDCTACIWDAETYECLHILDEHWRDINSAVFSPDGKKIVTSSLDSFAYVWDSETGKHINRLRCGVCNHAEFSPDNKYILTVSCLRGLKLWDARTHECLQTIKIDDPNYNPRPAFNFASFSPDGEKIISGTDDTNIRTRNVYY